jgi:hypothetical protein
MSTLSDATLTFQFGMMAQPNSSDVAVEIRLNNNKARYGSIKLNVGDGMRVAYQNISMAVATTGSDVDLTAFVDQLSGDTLNFSFIHLIMIVNDTSDVTALLSLSDGATNGWTAPGASWFREAYGLDADGGFLPGYAYNPNTHTSFDWATSGSNKTIQIVSNTPTTATTLTGRLIVIGRL